MKGKLTRKVLAFMLTLAMVMTYMPTLAFAAKDNQSTVEQTVGEEPAEEKVKTVEPANDAGDVYVAQIGEQGYKTLQGAVDALTGTSITDKKNGTIILLDSFEITEQLTVTFQDTTLDLNGNILTTNLTGTNFKISGSTSLTLKDSKGGGQIESKSNLPFQVGQDCTLNIQSGTYKKSPNQDEFFVFKTRGKCEITGGTFNGDPTDYVPAGYTVQENTPSEGFWTVTEDIGNNVAKIGNDKYTSIQAAIGAANEGDTIVLLADFEDTHVSTPSSPEGVITIPNNKNVVIDLNGHTVNGGTKVNVPAILNYGTVVIKDTANEKGLIKRDDVLDQGSHWYVIKNEGTMTLNDINVSNEGRTTGGGASMIENGDDTKATNAQLTINSGNYSNEIYTVVKVEPNTTAVINGGTFDCSLSGPMTVQTYGTLTVNGGSFTIIPTKDHAGDIHGTVKIHKAAYILDTNWTQYIEAGSVAVYDANSDYKYQVRKTTPSEYDAKLMPDSSGVEQYFIGGENAANIALSKQNSTNTAYFNVAPTETKKLESGTYKSWYAQGVDINGHYTPGPGYALEDTFDENTQIHTYSLKLTEEGALACVIHSDNSITYYDTLVKAGKAAQAGETVKALKDNKESKQPPTRIWDANSKSGVTVDLAGKQVDYNLAPYGAQTITIVDSVGGAKATSYISCNKNGCEMVIKSGGFTGTLSASNGGVLRIEGGYYVNDPIAFVPKEGSYEVITLVEGDEGYAESYRYKVINAVAQIGDTKYETLQAAVNAAESGQTIKLLSNTTETVTIDKAVTIDGQGHKVTGATATNPICLKFEGTEAYSASISDLKLDATSSGYPIYVAAPVNLSITGGQTDGYCSIYFKPGCSGAKVNATETTFNAPSDKDGLSNGFGMFVIREEDVELTLDNCTMDATKTGTAKFAVIQSGKETGTKTLSKGYTVTIKGDNTLVKGDLIYNNGYTNTSIVGDLNHVRLQGGTYQTAKADIFSTDNTADLVITGGTYAFNPAVDDFAKYLDPDYTSHDNGNDTWTVVPKEAIASVTVDGVTTEHGSLKKIEQIVKDSGEKTVSIKLLANVTGTLSFPGNSNVNLDLNGFDLSSNENTVSSRGKLTICDNSTEQDGKITTTGTENYVVLSTSENIQVAEHEYIDLCGNITIESGLFVGDLKAYEGCKLVVKGGKFDRDVNNNYIVQGKIDELKDGWYILREIDQNDYVAKIGDKKYLTIQDALNNAYQGETYQPIILLKDAICDLSINNSQYEFRGEHTLTCNDKIIAGTFNCHVVMANDAKIKGGTFAYEPDAKDLEEWYIANDNGNDTYTVAKMTLDQAKNAGYVAASSISTSSMSINSRKYYKNLTDINSARYLLKDLGNYSATYDYASSATLYLNGYNFSGSIDGTNLGDEKGLTISDNTNQNKTASLSSITVNKLTVAANTNVTIGGGKVKTLVVNGNLSVTGGYFGFDPTVYVASGCEVVALSSESTGADKEAFDAGYKHKVCKYVAQIGDKKYETLAEAIAAAQTGDEIDLIADIETSEEIKFPNSFNGTLDLNGHKISAVDGSGEAHASVVSSSGNLTIKDSDPDKKGTIELVTTENSSIWVGKNTINVSAGTLTIESGNFVFDSSKNAWAGYVINETNNESAANVIINGGNFTSVKNGDAVIRMHDQDCRSGELKLTINDGIFTGGAGDAVIWVDVQGNTSHPNTSKVTAVINDGTFTAADGQYAIDIGSGTNADSNGLNVQVNGGKYNTGHDEYLMRVRSISESNLSSIKVSGGIFDKDKTLYRYNSVDSSKDLVDYVVKGKTVIDNLDVSTKTEYPYTIGIAPVAPVVDEKTIEIKEDGKETTGTEEASNEAKSVVEEVEKNNQVDAPGATNIQDVATPDRIETATSVNNVVDSALRIALKSIAITTEKTETQVKEVTTNSIKYDVKPIFIYTDSEGNQKEAELTNAQLTEILSKTGQTAINFRLAVPSTMTGKFVKVNHYANQDTIDWSKDCLIEGSGDQRYVELSASSFSEYELVQNTEASYVARNEQTKALYTTLFEAVNEAVPNQTVQLIADDLDKDRLASILADEGVTIDFAGHKVAAKYIISWGKLADSKGGAEINVKRLQYEDQTAAITPLGTNCSGMMPILTEKAANNTDVAEYNKYQLYYAAVQQGTRSQNPNEFKAYAYLDESAYTNKSALLGNNPNTSDVEFGTAVAFTNSDSNTVLGSYHFSQSTLNGYLAGTSYKNLSPCMLFTGMSKIITAKCATYIDSGSAKTHYSGSWTEVQNITK